jgi:hypothetical protein
MKKRGILITLAALLLFGLTPDARADWSTAKRLSWISGEAYSAAIAVDSNDAIHVVWYNYAAGAGEDVYYRRSTDGGTTWTPAQKLNGTLAHSCDPAIAIDSNDRIHVVWSDYVPDDGEDIYYRRSDNGGTTWNTVKRLTWTSGDSEYPAITSGPGNTVHIAWVDDTPGHWEVYYKQSTNGGTTWGTNKRLTVTADSASADSPVIAVSSDSRVHVAWHKYMPGNPELYYRRSTDGGTTWNTVQRLTWTSGGSFRPVIGLGSGSAIHMVWQDDTPGNAEVYYKKSTDGGATWGTAKRLTSTSGSSWSPDMAVDSSTAIHVVWGDSTPGNFEMYYKKSTDGGESWSAKMRLSWTSGQSDDPAVAADSSDTVHIVWEDDTPGSYQIYYKKGK